MSNVENAVQEKKFDCYGKSGSLGIKLPYNSDQTMFFILKLNQFFGKNHIILTIQQGTKSLLLSYKVSTEGTSRWCNI